MKRYQGGIRRLEEKFDPAEWAAVHDRSEGSRPYLSFRRNNELVEKICLEQSRADEVWLDLGCGTGHLAAKLSGKGLRVFGVDHDARMTRFATQHFSGPNGARRLTFVTARAESLPFRDDALHGVAAVSLAGCLSSPDLFFQEVHRVLRRKGLAVITFTNHNSLLFRADAFSRRVFGFFMKSRGPGERYQTYVFENVVSRMQDIGFEICRVQFLNFFVYVGGWPIPPGRFGLSAEFLSRSKKASHLAKNFILLARKV